MTPGTAPVPRKTGQQAASDEELAWLALRMTPGLGTRKAGQLIAVFRTPQAILHASRSELEAAGVSPAVAQSIASGCGYEEAAEQSHKLREAGAALIPITDPSYPAPLREIFDPPPVLFARGRFDLLDTLTIGVVGTRRPTAYGTAATTRLARDLAQAGLTIASGMARGIDTAAHRAALEVGGSTVAVFGCGVDQVYPAENRKLAEQIAAQGLIVSEFPMGAPPYPQNFPVRNRVISGISVGILVVEGSEYSGSSITAKLAVEQNRDVFAVPGNITSKMSWGPNLLIKQGAKLVQEWNDIVVELKPEQRRRLADQFRNQLKIEDKEGGETPDAASASVHSGVGTSETGKFGGYDFGPNRGIARAILNTLRPDSPLALDHLVEGTEGCSASEVIALLFELELAGLIRQLPGKQYVKVWGD